jgi:hypothetical protein
VVPERRRPGHRGLVSPSQQWGSQPAVYHHAPCTSSRGYARERVAKAIQEEPSGVRHDQRGVHVTPGVVTFGIFTYSYGLPQAAIGAQTHVQGVKPRQLWRLAYLHRAAEPGWIRVLVEWGSWLACQQRHCTGAAADVAPARNDALVVHDNTTVATVRVVAELVPLEPGLARVRLRLAVASRERRLRASDQAKTQYRELVQQQRGLWLR